MTKDEFLSNQDTQSFLDWFQVVVTGAQAIEFPYSSEDVDKFLSDALVRYRWPPRGLELSTPAGTLTIRRHSGLAENADVLDKLSKGIKSCLAVESVNASELADWARAIMQWGGVFTRRGNAPWLKRLGTSLPNYFKSVLLALGADDSTLLNRLPALRSNAGTTKIHSLILPDFVIYDSRVAAALAWLVQTWAQGLEDQIPEHLRFGCMRANTQKKPGKPRSPDEKIFKYFVASGDVANHRKHAMWNRRANWIISAVVKALTDATEETVACKPWTCREIEAALFVMGEDLTAAIS
jgi:hypothetical protein